MLWVVLGLIILAAILDSDSGKFVVAIGVVAIGFLFLGWISGFAIFGILAKVCAALIVLTVVALILQAIFD